MSKVPLPLLPDFHHFRLAPLPILHPTSPWRTAYFWVAVGVRDVYYIHLSWLEYFFGKFLISEQSIEIYLSVYGLVDQCPIFGVRWEINALLSAPLLDVNLNIFQKIPYRSPIDCNFWHLSSLSWSRFAAFFNTLAARLSNNWLFSVHSNHFSAKVI